MSVPVQIAIPSAYGCLGRSFERLEYLFGSIIMSGSVQIAFPSAYGRLGRLIGRPEYLFGSVREGPEDLIRVLVDSVLQLVSYFGLNEVLQFRFW